MEKLLGLSLIFVPWIGALVLWMITDRKPALQHALAVSFSLLASICGWCLIGMSSEDSIPIFSLGGIFGEFSLLPDGLGVTIAAIATTIGCLAVIFSIDYMKHDPQLSRYYALVLFFIGGMAGLGLSGSLLFVFLFWEITAFCSYALISFHNDDPKAVAGGIKALIMTQFGGLGLLAGTFFLSSATKSYQIPDIFAHSSTITYPWLTLSAYGFLIAAMAKSAQVPLHSWLPDAMEAPTPVTALIHAATMVNAGVYLLARFQPLFTSVPGWDVSLMIVGALSALLTGCMALVTFDIKRLLAYSTISQLGYMVYAIGCGSIFASQFHLLNHAIFKALLFLSAGAVITAVGTRDMQRMGGLGRQMPFVRASMVVGSLALVGIPISNGFFSKELILESGAIHSPDWIFGVLLFSVALTAMYTLRMVALVFFGTPLGQKAQHDGLPAMRISLGILSLGALVSWGIAGDFSALLHHTLPYHRLHTIPTIELVLEVTRSTTTFASLGIIVLSFAIWVLRERFTFVANILRPMSRWASADFSFEWINQKISESVRALANTLSLLQTGVVNWNILYIIMGLLAVITILIQGV